MRRYLRVVRGVLRGGSDGLGGEVEKEAARYGIDSVHCVGNPRCVDDVMLWPVFMGSCPFRFKESICQICIKE